ncbi:helix-turn-helix domain-containing protein [Paeniglutamicibacter terrestris]|uniref:Helix-turn-helix transcriptional regulator n=1 Tax=Paeniglutamicibacter terrestris TaxID=2723403 RepID=A0ABX1G7K1_9MICC|nr:helix-turn-helix transcriptional regulator [Paeniglutamicibacter terrestris]NKG22248.1 helix-turn-helix transcriptional regulator [Paeniglutamicibacter terrestris]
MTTKKLSDIELAIAAVVRVEMAKRRLSANKFAKALGISQPSLSAKLRGDTKFSIGEIESFASEMGLSLSWVILEAERQLVSDPSAIFGLAADDRTEDSMRQQEIDQELP